MHKIGIISDTHGILRPEVAGTLKGCELILHGGDINKQKVLDELKQIAPVFAVRGNNDKTWAEHLPEFLTLNICGIQVFMVHDKAFIPEDLTGIRLVIYGHSHKYEKQTSGGILYLNPGSCGPRRFRQEITFAILYIEDDKTFRIEKFLIRHPVKPHKEASGKKIPGGKIPAKKLTDEMLTDEKLTVNIALMLPAIMREIDAGKTVPWIAARHHISEELSDQINRMYLTHPGVDVDGILRRLGL